MKLNTKKTEGDTIKRKIGKGDLLSNCCAWDFDAFGAEKDEGVYQERCLKCGKLCEPLWIGELDIKNIRRLNELEPLKEEKECGCEADERGIKHLTKAHEPSQPSPKIGWEERFDKKFVAGKEHKYLNNKTMLRPLKSFISQLLEEQGQSKRLQSCVHGHDKYDCPYPQEVGKFCPHCYNTEVGVSSNQLEPSKDVTEEIKQTTKYSGLFWDEGYKTGQSEYRSDLIKRVEKMKKKCKHTAHIEPCNDIKVITYNLALSEVLDILKEE